jgi:hypothetical protein
MSSSNSSERPCSVNEFNVTSNNFFISELGAREAFVIAAAAWADADGATRPLDGIAPEPAAAAAFEPPNDY